ncbi:hypothetical protein [Shinella zoogloeoides]|uniref:hypothetical protein n=1 Tax=Shinella zoogloeoides TaxID=352475 RepID=UPI0028B06128|nr:hypothetical protein [Shinella zoogloeoides]
MNHHKNLYCMTNFHQGWTNTVPAADERDYEGQLVFSGPDVAIEVIGDQIQGYVNGRVSHPNGQLAEMIENYRRWILDGAQSLKREDTVCVIILGRWHHVEFDMRPRFEAYLVHLVSRSGDITTLRYEIEIFDWDDPELNNGGGFGFTLTGSAEDDVEGLKWCAQQKLGSGKKWYDSSSGLATVDAVLWYPAEGRSLPMVVSSVSEETAAGEGGLNSAPGEGSPPDVLSPLLAAIRKKQAEILAEPSGEFRGVTTDRKTNRPQEMTLSEALASTDAIGFWFQTWSGEDEPYSSFVFAYEDLERGESILKRLDGDVDRDHALGNMYASDWEGVRYSSNLRFRHLLIGPHPEVDERPI